MDSRSGIGAITRSLGLTSEWDLQYADLYRSKHHLFVSPTNLMCSCLIRRGRNGITAHRQFLDVESRLVKGDPEVSLRWLTDHQIPKAELMPDSRQFFLKGKRLEEHEICTLDEKLQEETAMLSNLPGTAAVALRYAVVKNKNPQYFINEPMLWVPRELGTVEPEPQDGDMYDNQHIQVESLLLQCISGQGLPYSYASREIRDLFEKWFKASPLKVYRAYACSMDALYVTIQKIPGAINELVNVVRQVQLNPHACLGCGEISLHQRWMIKRDSIRFTDCVPWYMIDPKNWININNDNSFVLGRRVDITSGVSDAILCLAGMGYDLDYSKIEINTSPEVPQKLPPVDTRIVESKPAVIPTATP
jgi:hypothetical protein